ncbi:EscF/YscF/HrpA family type III secretion system needle major subunit [Streptomyces cavourensis]|nr:EscF/YscF/HrpA family type III secretion system needle major subunit [Streptomyces cavourensis]
MATPILTANDESGSTNFIDNLYDQFANAKVDGKTYQQYLEEKIKALGDGDSANPQKLAEYQKAVMVYTVHLNAQSAMIKSIADLDKGIVHQFN